MKRKVKYRTLVHLGIILVVLGLFTLGFYLFYLKGQMMFSKMEKYLLETAKDYYQENKDELPKKDVCATSSWVKVLKEDEKYQYFAYLSCGKYNSKIDHVGPSIELNGDSTIVLNLNDPYQELGVKKVVDNVDKNIDTNKVVIDASKVDTSKVGSYEVSYTAEDKLKNQTTIYRNVQVSHFLSKEIENKTDETNTFKGYVDNNYVWYSGFMFRIMKLTDDDIRLVTDEPVSTVMAGVKIKSYMESDTVKWLNDYFKRNFADPEKILKTGNKFMVNDMYEEKNIELTLDIGSITYDEYYASVSETGTTYKGTYLNKNQPSFALLSYFDSTTDEYNIAIFLERKEITIEDGGVFTKAIYKDYTPMHIRPVIVIKRDSLIYGGDGTKENPYLLTMKKNESKKLNEHTSGEYVEFSNLLWRIVHINENGTTRLVLNQDIYEDGESKLITDFDKTKATKFDPNQEGNIGYFLNHEFIMRLNEDKLDYADFDITNYDFDEGYQGLQKKFISAKIGTIAIGEMFSTQPSYMQNPVWVMNSYLSNAGFIRNGYVNYGEPNFHYYSNVKTTARPVINVKSDVEIIKGSGTSTDPYIVK